MSFSYLTNSDPRKIRDIFQMYRLYLTNKVKIENTFYDPVRFGSIFENYNIQTVINRWANNE